MTETPGERNRRMYSSAYQEGQRLSSYPKALARMEAAAEHDSDPYWRSLGAHWYTAGFRDGWHGRVPQHELRLADTLP